MIALTALAGGLGAALRLVVDGMVMTVVGRRLPWGTLAVNVVGSLALGALVGSGSPGAVIAVVGTGLLGGFTTFSTASFETAVLVLERRPIAGIGYGALTLTGAVGAAALGYVLTN